MEEICHVIVKVVNNDCEVLKQLKERGIARFRIVDVRSIGGKSTLHLVELGSQSRRKSVESVKSKWFKSEGCTVCRTILERGAFLISGEGDEKGVFIYSFVTPSFASYREILETLKSMGHYVQILKIKRFKPTGDVLTKRQEKVLWLALTAGFFDYPRRVGVKEMAEMLGVSPSTLSEILRRGLKRLLEYYFNPSRKR